jgi:hypothetical protein
MEILKPYLLLETLEVTDKLDVHSNSKNQFLQGRQVGDDERIRKGYTLLCVGVDSGNDSKTA